MTGEIDHVLAGAAAGLKHRAGFPRKARLQHVSDRLMIAVERRRVETAVGFDRPSVLAEFHDIFSHQTLLPRFWTARALIAKNRAGGRADRIFDCSQWPGEEINRIFACPL